MLTPPLVWLILGLLLCILELFLPTAFTEFMMGVSAIAVAVISLVVPWVGVQIALWMVLSLVSVYLVQRLLPKSRMTGLEPTTEAETLTEITPGQAGRVLYDGVSWRAICNDDSATILPHQRVYVVGQKGTTLLVVPEKLLKG